MFTTRFAAALALASGVSGLATGDKVTYYQESTLERYGTMNYAQVFPAADTYPNQATGGAEDSLVWEVAVQSYYNLDEGEVYIELIHELKMNVYTTDVIEFKLKFIPDEGAPIGVTLEKDMMVCTLQEDLNASGYWTSEAVDYNVRSDTVAEDTNASEVNEGQDWFIPRQDVDMNTHLCTAPTATNSDIACTAILCIARRKAVTTDTDDFGFDTVGEGASATEDIMRIEIGDAELHINMVEQTDTYKQYISNLQQIDLTLGAGAFAGLSLAAAAVAVSTATLF
jgi:hypothetical protein